MLGGMLGPIFKDYFTIQLNENLEFIFKDLNGVEMTENEVNFYCDMVFGGNNYRMIHDFAKREFSEIFDLFLKNYRVILEKHYGDWELEYNKQKVSYEKFYKTFLDKFSYLENGETIKNGALGSYIDNWFYNECQLVSEKLLNKGLWYVPENKNK